MSNLGSSEWEQDNSQDCINADINNSSEYTGDNSLVLHNYYFDDNISSEAAFKVLMTGSETKNSNVVTQNSLSSQQHLNSEGRCKSQMIVPEPKNSDVVVVIYNSLSDQCQKPKTKDTYKSQMTVTEPENSNTVVQHISLTNFTKSDLSCAVSSTKPTSSKSFDQSAIADLRKDLERIKRDLQSQEAYTDALARQIIGSDCSLDTVYSDESIKNINIYSKFENNNNEHPFELFSDSEDTDEDSTLTKDFNEITQIQDYVCNRTLIENQNDINKKVEEINNCTPISNQSCGNAMVCTTQRSTPYVKEPLAEPKQCKVLSIPNTSRDASTLNKFSAKSIGTKPVTSSVSPTRLGIKRKREITRTSSGPSSPTSECKKKKLQTIPHSPKVSIGYTQKSARKCKSASTPTFTHTAQNVKANSAQTTRGMSAASTTRTVIKNKCELVETPKPRSHSQTQKSVKKKSECKTTPHTSKNAIAGAQKSATKSKVTTTPAYAQSIRTPNKMKTNSSLVKSATTPTYAQSVRTPEKLKTNSTLKKSEASAKSSGINNKRELTKTPMSRSCSPSQQCKKRKPQSKATPQSPRNETASAKKLVPKSKTPNTSTRAIMATPQTPSSNRTVHAKELVPKSKTPHTTTRTVGITSTRVTRSVPRNMGKIKRSPTPYPHRTYTPSSKNVSKLSEVKRDKYNADIVCGHASVKSKTELKSHEENSIKNITGELNAESSFCVHCLNKSEVVINKFLIDELQKIIGTHNKTNVILAITLQKNGLYHVNASLQPNGDYLGCLYANKQSIVEAATDHEFERYLKVFVASDPNTIDEHQMINFDIQFASHKS